MLQTGTIHCFWNWGLCFTGKKRVSLMKRRQNARWAWFGLHFNIVSPSTQVHDQHAAAGLVPTTQSLIYNFYVSATTTFSRVTFSDQLGSHAVPFSSNLSGAEPLYFSADDDDGAPTGGRLGDHRRQRWLPPRPDVSQSASAPDRCVYGSMSTSGLPPQ